jgi:signal transduction histidine kinase
MSMSTSSDFVALCQEQMVLLAQGLGASLSVVYLTQELVETPTNEVKLIPVVVYPEPAVELSGTVLALPSHRGKFLKAAQELPAPLQEVREEGGSTHPKGEYLLSGDQFVLPLIHEEVMLGLLVTCREDRAWNAIERSSIERIAQTLAIACMLDRRQVWLQQQLHQQQILQDRQRDLLDNLLHQFRNPLTALRTFGQLLLKRLRPGDINREVATSIVRESDRLKELLQSFDEVIDLTTEDLAPLKLIQDKGRVHQSKTSLLLPKAGDEEAEFLVADVLEPLLVSAKAIALERSLLLSTEMSPNLPLVRGNMRALREVLSNIIDNALKYTPVGGKILIKMGQEKPHFQGIIISDNGPGIPNKDLVHLGERHYRGVQAQTSIPGTGLGLAIAKELIGQMHGEIEVHSPALDSHITLPNRPGTTFVIWLPLA